MSWLQKLETAIAGEADKIPAGWFSVETESKRLKISKRCCQGKISTALALGVLKRQKFKVVLNGKFRRVFYYKEV